MTETMPGPEPNPSQTRASLVEGLQTGDEDRWQQFYRLYGPMIRGFALKAGLTETEADEVMQETCIGLAKNVGEFHYDPAKCRFKTWLLNLASWRVKNQFTKRQRWDERVHARVNPANDPDGTATIERDPDPNAQNLDMLWDAEWRGSLLKTALEKVRAKFSATQFQVFDLNEYPLPTPAQLNRHLHLYGREGTDVIRSILAKPESPDELAVKSAEANTKEQARKRTARRTGIKEQARALLARSPELNYMALADALNVGDRRAKSLLDELAISA